MVVSNDKFFLFATGHYEVRGTSFLFSLKKEFCEAVYGGTVPYFTGIDSRFKKWQKLDIKWIIFSNWNWTEC